MLDMVLPNRVGHNTYECTWDQRRYCNCSWKCRHTKWHLEKRLRPHFALIREPRPKWAWCVALKQEMMREVLVLQTHGFLVLQIQEQAEASGMPNLYCTEKLERCYDIDPTKENNSRFDQWHGEALEHSNSKQTAWSRCPNWIGFRRPGCDGLAVRRLLLSLLVTTYQISS